MSDYVTVRNWMNAELAASGSTYPSVLSDRSRQLATNAATYFSHPEWVEDGSSHWIWRAASRAVSGKVG